MQGKALLPGFICAVLALHAAALSLPWSRPALAPRLAPQPALQLRWLASPADAVPALTGGEAEGSPGRATAPVHAAREQPASTAGPPIEAGDAELGRQSAGDAWDAYVPRPMLSLAPQPGEPVMLEWPAFDGERARYAGVLALYIDEQGRVQRVAVEGEELPAVLAEAARHAFAGLSFTPGEVDGQPVKSLIHVEVSFEQAERPRPAARGIQP